MTLDTTKVATLVAPVEEVAPVATPYDIAVKKIVDEAFAKTGCTEDEAAATLDWVQGIVNRIREYGSGYRTYHPNDRDMATRQYDIFDTVIPHGKTSAEGSAHQAIEQAGLDPSLGELSLLHDDTGTVRRRNCTVTISTQVFDAS